VKPLEVSSSDCHYKTQKLRGRVKSNRKTRGSRQIRAVLVMSAGFGTAVAPTAVLFHALETVMFWSCTVCSFHFERGSHTSFSRKVWSPLCPIAASASGRSRNFAEESPLNGRPEVLTRSEQCCSCQRGSALQSFPLLPLFIGDLGICDFCICDASDFRSMTSFPWLGQGAVSSCDGDLISGAWNGIPS